MKNFLQTYLKFNKEFCKAQTITQILNKSFESQK